MATMNVSVPDLMRDWVQSRVDNGRYASASDYVRDLIRKDQAELIHGEELLASLDKALAQAIADDDAGRVTPAEEVFDRLSAKYAAMAAKRANT